MEPVRWIPNDGPQTDFGESSVYELLYGGARGGGKTDAVVTDHIYGVHHPEYRGLILRKTFPELKEVVDRCHKYYPVIQTPNGRITSKYNGQDHTWNFSTGAKVELGSMHTEESKYKYIGRQFVKISFDQLEQFSETQYQFMLGQIRTPVQELTELLGVRSTANPGGMGHAWVKARFIDNKIPYKVYEKCYETPLGKITLTSSFIPAKVYDNPAITKNDPQYIAQLMALPDDLRKAWLDGDWNVFMGQFFTEYRSDVHGVDPFEIPDDWLVWGGLDYGEANQTSFGLYVSSPDGRLYRVAEYYSSGIGPDHDREIWKTIDECKWTKDREGKARHPGLVYADPSMWIQRQHDIGRIKSAAMAMSLPLARASNDRINGWRTVKRLLHWDMDDNGLWIVQPKFYYFKSECPNFERTIPSVVHAGTLGKPNAEDAKKGGEDHCADELRYMCMGFYGHPDKPEPPEPEKHIDAHRARYQDKEHGWDKKITNVMKVI